MTKALWPYVFGKQLGEQQVLIDDVSKRILEKPIEPLVEWVDLNDCAVKESSTTSEALRLISNIPYGFMLVVGRGRGFLGMVTLTPICKAVAADRVEVKVKELCTLRKNIIDIKVRDTVKSSLITFHRYGFRRLFVIDQDDMTKVGVLKRSVLMRWLIEQLILESENSA